jgi:hypothetical protein
MNSSRKNNASPIDAAEFILGKERDYWTCIGHLPGWISMNTGMGLNGISPTPGQIVLQFAEAKGRSSGKFAAWLEEGSKVSAFSSAILREFSAPSAIHSLPWLVRCS